MDKNQKQLVSEHCQRDKIPNPVYLCTPEKEINSSGFFCTLTVGQQTFRTSDWQRTKKAAEMEAAKIACDTLALEHTNAELKQFKVAEKAAEKAANPPNPPKAALIKDPDWITIEKVEDIYKYLTDEVLAQEFKAFLHCKAQEEKKGYPAFSVAEVGDKGFVGTVTYDGASYQSLGVMLTKKQAEQSAAEICLRSLGDFPDVEKDKYTIQVYRGGQIHIPPTQKKTPYQPGVTSTPRPFYGLLQQCVGNLNLQYPSYKYKEESADEKSTYTAVVFFEGKLFQTRTPTESLVAAKEQACEEALKYLGIPDPQEGHALRECIRIRKRRSFVPLGPLTSPFSYCPSKRASWIFHRFQPLDEMTGVVVTKQDDVRGIMEIRSSPSQTIDEVFERAMAAEPRIGGTSLSTRGDLSVGEVNSENKSNVIIGNNECSIRMFCEDGKIMCKNRNSKVDLLAGHNIRGLKCSYQIMYPSLQVYLKAESCDDLFYPNPPLPVVAKCGMAMLMYDHEANVQDLHILLTRPSDKKTFVSKAKYLASYLNKLISTNAGPPPHPSRFNVADCVSNITTWAHKELQLMSDMTMDSMHELMSLYVRYDDRWNEIFARELTDILQELKAAAVGELARRSEEGVEEEEDNEPWLLPNAPFQHRLHASGVFIENNVQCTFRSVNQMTGLKVKLSDIEESPVINVPQKENPNAHRGDVCRYYIWKGLRKVSGNEDDPYYKPIDITTQLGDGWSFDNDYGKRKNKSGPKQNYRQKRRMTDNENGTEVKKENGDATVATDATAVAAAPQQPMEEERKTYTPNPNQAQNQLTKPIHEECRWFPLEEAKKICPILTGLAKNAVFKNQVKALQLEANAFMKEKANNVVA